MKAGVCGGLLTWSSARRSSAEWFRAAGSQERWEAEKNSARRWCFQLEKGIWFFRAASSAHTFLSRGLDYSAIAPSANAETQPKPSTMKERGTGSSLALPSALGWSSSGCKRGNSLAGAHRKKQQSLNIWAGKAGAGCAFHTEHSVQGESAGGKAV